jgi:hypothetical protein
MNYRFGSKVTCDRARHEAIRHAEALNGNVRHEVHCTPDEFAVLVSLAEAHQIGLRRMRLHEAVRVLAASDDPTAQRLLSALDPSIVAAAVAAPTTASDPRPARPVSSDTPSAQSSAQETDTPPQTKHAMADATGRPLGQQSTQSEFLF